MPLPLTPEGHQAGPADKLGGSGASNVGCWRRQKQTLAD